MPDEFQSKTELKGLLTGRRLSHDSNQLLIEIMERWGGPTEFARSLQVEFASARAGSLIRQNILEMIQKLVVNNTNHAITKLADPSDLSTEDIDRELEALLAKAKDHIADAKNAKNACERTAPWDVEDSLDGQ